MAGDEVFVKERDGSWRVWRNGQWSSVSAPSAPAATSSPREPLVTPPPVAVPPPALPPSKPVPAPTPTPAPILTPSVVPPTPVPATPPPVPTAPVDPLDEVAEGIVRDAGVSSLSPELMPRLINIVKLRLKDVRDTVDTRDALLKPVESGGLGLSEDLVDGIIQTILTHIPRLSRGTIGAAPSVEVRSAAQPSPIANQSSSSKPSSSTPITPLVSSPDRKSSMVDVRSRPEAVGPIDELRLFTPVDFRRLDPNPKQAATRLREKVKLLEDESYEKMVDGVRAWRTSPLHRLYLGIGQESLTSGKSVADVIAGRKASNQPTLSADEFDAIMDLNKNLRF